MFSCGSSRKPAMQAGIADGFDGVGHGIQLNWTMLSVYYTVKAISYSKSVGWEANISQKKLGNERRAA